MEALLQSTDQVGRMQPFQLEHWPQLTTAVHVMSLVRSHFADSS